MMLAAHKTATPRETTASQRQGNCVSCNGESRFQIGRLNGRAMNNANSVNTTTARSSRCLRRSCRRKKDEIGAARAGALKSSVISRRMFIHQTFRLSGEKVDSRKLKR